MVTIREAARDGITATFLPKPVIDDLSQLIISNALLHGRFDVD
jgi:hypothetical protein